MFFYYYYYFYLFKESSLCSCSQCCGWKMCPVRRSLIQQIAKRDVGTVKPAFNGTTMDRSLFPLQEISI